MSDIDNFQGAIDNAKNSMACLRAYDEAWDWAQDRIAELEQQLRWIPVSEEYPDPHTPIFVTHKEDEMHCACIRLRDDNYECLEGGELLGWIPTHWLPIPPTGE